ncbi:MAG: serine acetyltransferase [Muribaculaceae bacterium]|nr:serine acetyltransferase [Muribaculaceae bacterium]
MIELRNQTSEEIVKELSSTVKKLSDIHTDDRSLMSLCPEGLPSLQNVKEIMSLLWKLMFPELFFERTAIVSRIEYRIGITTERLFELLQEEIVIGLSCRPKRKEKVVIDNYPEAHDLSMKIISFLPELKRLLYTDINAILRKDPAAGNEVEIILCYPSVKAMLHHRFAHLIFSMNIPYLPRIISELAHSHTGIDIHPGATIGEYFAIDHGTGVVIGETCIIGNNVTLYQGVTLGAKSFRYDGNGTPLNIPRHPIIEDNVTIYSNATILGRITIGHDTVIGGNVWVTESLPAYSRVIQGGIRNDIFSYGAGI